MISKKTISFILKISIVFFSIYFLYVQFILKIEDNQVSSFSIFKIINSKFGYKNYSSKKKLKTFLKLIIKLKYKKFIKY